jgi:UDP-N-acetylglucosamine/UDP-N-acetylgalactosamine diphosphorylase
MSTTSTTMDEQEIRQRYEQAGQAHVFDHYDDILDVASKQSFLQQLNAIAVESLASLYTAALEQEAASSHASSPIQPYSGPTARSTDAIEEYWKVGIDAIAHGRVAALVLAGGQGTRLGYAGPKGMYDIGLPSGKSLFQLLAERILKLNQLAAHENGSDLKIVLPFYIMTSPLNHDETVAYFAEQNYFGLGEPSVFFFPQGMLPCLTPGEGKMILESAGAVAMAPDGNGGIYPALQSSGALRDMTQRGIQYLHVFSIDNALVKPADPVFIGYCIREGADCGNKVVWKAHAHEKVGVMASRDARPCIVEYSELTVEMAEQTDAATGQLLYGAGNICNHFYTLDFIEQTVLPNMNHMYHTAHKKIPYYDAVTKSTVVPTDANNGIKLETFIFDVFSLSQHMAILEVERNEEFAPVKNAPGSTSDTPESACALLSQRSRQWIVQAGGNLLGDLAGGICEISPSTSYAGEGLEVTVQGKVVECPFNL